MRQRPGRRWGQDHEPTGTRTLGATDRQRAEHQPWQGPLRIYDIINEATIAVVVVTILTVALAVVLSSIATLPPAKTCDSATGQDNSY